MFAKTLLSVLSLGITIVGLLIFFNTGEYLTFAIGFALYFIAAVSNSFCKKMSD
ncbi:hypothetical protein [Polynucleobacter sp. CS-Odin-A6]|uniref:hypothetical protein n=1 Tax=Polynucleobacter sp. CS-Odin-A6 TaxID=2689106 RepID=UPI001C0DCB1E|nr:hypothetical protein [Polynucleobacter sp. CS-Odin-A6]MBU3620397.1 hypothetical protein [Polynucleobacter sp. CS-Odin-A6]